MRILRYCILVTLFAVVAGVAAQERRVENRPYCDLRPFHLGVIVGTNFQDAEFNNMGPVTLTDADGNEYTSVVTCDQNQWDNGFHVGVLGEMRINEHLAFRMAPTLYFGNRRYAFHNYKQEDMYGMATVVHQDMKTVYIGGDMGLIFAAKRFNNHRPYMMAGVCPMLNLTNGGNNYLKFNSGDLFVELGIGCDFYMPFFKLRPEIKFMYGLTNCLNKKHSDKMEDANKLPYTRSVDEARSKMIALTFYFE